MLKFRQLDASDRFQYPGAQPDAMIAKSSYLHFDFDILIGNAEDRANVFIYNRTTDVWEGEYTLDKERARKLTEPLSYDKFQGLEFTDYGAYHAE